MWCENQTATQILMFLECEGMQISCYADTHEHVSMGLRNFA